MLMGFQFLFGLFIYKKNGKNSMQKDYAKKYDKFTLSRT